MKANWIKSSTELPREGQQIAFVLDDRSVPIQGAYIDQVFRSRWAEYAIGRVLSWCDLAVERDRAAPVRHDAACALSSMSRHDTKHDSLHASGIAHAV